MKFFPLLVVLVLSMSLFSCQKDVSSTTGRTDSAIAVITQPSWDSTLLIKKITYYYYNDTTFSIPLLNYTDEYNYDTINRIVSIRHTVAGYPNFNGVDSSFYDAQYNIIKIIQKYGSTTNIFNYTYNSDGFLISFVNNDWPASPLIVNVSYTSMLNGVLASYSMTPTFDHGYNIYKTRFQQAYDNNHNILWRAISEPIATSSVVGGGTFQYNSNRAYNHLLNYIYDNNANLKSVQKSVVDSTTVLPTIVAPLLSNNCLEVLERETQVNNAYAKNRFFNSVGLKGFDEMIKTVDSSYVDDPIDFHSYSYISNSLTGVLYPIKQAKFWYGLYSISSNGKLVNGGYFRHINFTNKLDAKNRFTEIYNYGSFYAVGIGVSYNDTKMIYEYYK